MKTTGVLEIQELLEIVRQTVERVRAQLSMTYDVNSEEYHNFAGLCYEASKMCSEYVKDEIKKTFNLDIEVVSIHGEQAHHPRIPSQKWAIQHTWIKILAYGYTIYADPTSGQFKHLYSDIPEFYVDTKKPFWYYSDRSNPVWNGITRDINKKIKFARLIKLADEEFTVHCGIIEILQFDVWGNISDFIRKFIYR